MKKRILPILFTAIFVCIFLTACNLKPACSHTAVTDAAVAPTCTQSGLTEGSHCSKCNAVITAQQPIPATHTGEWKTVVEPDCFYEGSEQRTCTVCDITETRKVANLEHKFVQDAETKLFACELCDGRIFKGHLYAKFEKATHWSEAYKICENLGGYLATITSEAEQSVIADMIKSIDTVANYWLGGIKDNGVWQWITGEEITYQNWDVGQPVNGPIEWYLGIKSTGFWHDYDYLHHPSGATHGGLYLICEWDLGIEESTHFFSEWGTLKEADCFGAGERTRFCSHCGLTETETVAQVAHNFVHNEANGLALCEHCSAVKHEGRIYKIFTQGLSWFGAQAYCDSIGGHLVTITSAEEQAFVENYMTAVNHSERAWIGAYSDGINYHWVTDEAFEYANWYAGMPDCYLGQEFFGHINFSGTFGQWNDYQPSLRLFFLCEWEAK